MKLVIGLGNPGEKYRWNRHNLGHIFIDETQNFGFPVPKERWEAVKTGVFMNDSGSFVKKRVEALRLKTNDLIIVHDDLDIALGKFKIQFGVGPKLHYGIQSIEAALKTKDFWRVRIGVDGREPNNRLPGEEYVLEDFNQTELDTLNNLLPKIWQELLKNFQ